MGGFLVSCPAQTIQCVMKASKKYNLKGFGTDSNLKSTTKMKYARKDSKTTKTLLGAVSHLMFELCTSKVPEVLFLGPTFNKWIKYMNLSHLKYTLMWSNMVSHTMLVPGSSEMPANFYQPHSVRHMPTVVQLDFLAHGISNHNGCS